MRKTVPIVVFPQMLYTYFEALTPNFNFGASKQWSVLRKFENKVVTYSTLKKGYEIPILFLWVAF